MAKNYITKTENKSLKAKQTTIDFILNYSKSFEVIKTKDFTFESHKN